MRKLGTISLAVFYLFISLGLTVNVHYCGGKIGSVKIFAKASKCCCGDIEQSKDCCDDQAYQVLFDSDEQQLTQSYRLHIDAPQEVLTSFTVHIETNEWVEDEVNLELLDLPPPEQQPKWLVNCALTYYG